MSYPELKPCPFCGQQPEYYPQVLLNRNAIGWSEAVVCHNCNFRFASRHGVDAVLRWNCRPSIKAPKTLSSIIYEESIPDAL